ncbi:MAG: hypothetical protein JWP27_674 [Flaviaesturariibacter sp.]|nr:hypothetical protein [Flaviaesturariibacter sp.]
MVDVRVLNGRGFPWEKFFLIAKRFNLLTNPWKHMLKVSGGLGEVRGA